MGGWEESLEPITPMEDERLEPTNEPNLERNMIFFKGKKYHVFFSPPNSGQTSPLYWETTKCLNFPWLAWLETPSLVEIIFFQPREGLSKGRNRTELSPVVSSLEA